MRRIFSAGVFCVALIGCFLLLGCFGIGPRAHAAQLVYEAVGTRDEIQPTIDRFRHDVLYGPTGDALDPAGSVKSISFDDLGWDRTWRQRTLVSGALYLEALNGEIAVSGSAQAGDRALFGDINPRYPTVLTPFSGASVGALMQDPGPTVAPSFLINNSELLGPRPSAVAAVFINVKSGSTAALGGFLWSGSSFRYPAPGAGEKGPFSFIGIIDDEAPLNLCWVELPPLSATSSSTDEGSTNLLVAVDDVTLGWTPARAPVVTQFEPTTGTVHSSVEIWGTDIMEATAVEFGGVPATFTSMLVNRLWATVPENAVTGPITVRTRGGSFTTTNVFTFVPMSAPVITSFTPGSGWAGQMITLDGQNLIDLTRVTFNGVDAMFGASITPPGGVRMNAWVPEGATTGPITVTTKYGSVTTVDPFVITAPHYDPPRLTVFWPSEGRPGTVVEVHGYNLNRVTEVRFNGTRAVFHYDGIMQYMVATVPMGSSTGPLEVTSPEGSSVAAQSFTVLPYPVLTGFTPASGQPGTTVTLAGTHLEDATSAWLGSTPVALRPGPQASFAVPVGADSGPITIRTSYGTYSSTESFTVTHVVPLISNFSPVDGVPGVDVEIQAMAPPEAVEPVDLRRVTGVRFGDADAGFRYDASRSTIIAVVPSAAVSGPITLVTEDGASVSTNLFTILPEVDLTGFTPDHGPPGTVVELLGSGLDQVTSVALRKANAEWSRSDRLLFTVPEQATTGPVVVLTKYSRKVTPGAFLVERPFDLRVGVEIGLTNATPPTDVRWKITVFNNGPEKATGIWLTNLLVRSDGYVADPWSDLTGGAGTGAGGLEVLSFEASHGAVSVLENRASWIVPTLDGFASATLSLVARASGSGIIYSLAQAHGDQVDPDLRNNRQFTATLLTHTNLLSAERMADGTFEISWPSLFRDAVLQQRPLAPGNAWSAVEGTVGNSNGRNRMQIPVERKGQMYQLIRRMP